MKTHPSINKYIDQVRTTIAFGGSQNEQAIRPDFINLVNAFAQNRNLKLIPEIKQANNTIPDGTLKDTFRATCGLYEAKDPDDNIDQQIQYKIQKGYDTENILFENALTAVLIQKGIEVQRVDIQKYPQKLASIITRFLDFKKEEIHQFNKAVQTFKENIPNLAQVLREFLDKAQKKPEFTQKRAVFLQQCQREINPNITTADIREMIIQHFLTSKLFMAIFREIDFHRENNIAKQIETLASLAFDKQLRKNFETQNQHFYTTLELRAMGVRDHHDKQFFLKSLYEEFYKAYNPKAADKLGVVYTPTEIVQFMLESADYLLYKHFNTGLASRGVNILDPATGTGTFIADLLDYIPAHKLAYKYANELFANEVAILPYYIAALNIEYIYWQKMRDYQEFGGLAFVDTLDNHFSLSQSNRQQEIGFTLTQENTARIQRQNAAKISVIIGNPPYNANQQNYNDQNANRAYAEIDKRIKQSFHKYSTAQKNDYDMYKRFYRWAMDRLDEKKGGIVAFVTNNSFIRGKRYDGFRKVVETDFDYIYIVDLGGNIRKNMGSGKKISNVFDIQVGVCIAFFIKTPAQPNQRQKLFYYTLKDEETKEQKLTFLKHTKIEHLPFETIYPDKNHNWLNLTDNDFEELLPVCSKQTKLARTKEKEQAIFKLFSNGVKTNRDAWVYDFDKKNLEEKAKFFSEIYNNCVEKQEMDDIIKWSHGLESNFKSRIKSNYDLGYIKTSLLRPFTKQYYYSEKLFSDRLTQNHYAIFGQNLDRENKVIAFSGLSHSKPFHCLATNILPCLDSIEKGQCLPLYRYNAQGARLANITDWGLAQFQNHYKNTAITKEDIFAYTYAVLHCPTYRKKYVHDLKREFPRIPFYQDFWHWSELGDKLLDLHINYESARPYPLSRKDLKLDYIPRPKLKADKNLGQIQIDEQTVLSGIPPAAWLYKLGNRSALEWVLDQYKEKKIKDATVAAKFNTYKFSAYKEQVISLLRRVCQVSLETVGLLGLDGSS